METQPAPDRLPPNDVGRPIQSIIYDLWCDMLFLISGGIVDSTHLQFPTTDAVDFLRIGRMLNDLFERAIKANGIWQCSRLNVVKIINPASSDGNTIND